MDSLHSNRSTMLCSAHWAHASWSAQTCSDPAPHTTSFLIIKRAVFPHNSSQNLSYSYRFYSTELIHRQTLASNFDAPLLHIADFSISSSLMSKKIISKLHWRDHLATKHDISDLLPRVSTLALEEHLTDPIHHDKDFQREAPKLPDFSDLMR